MIGKSSWLKWASAVVIALCGAVVAGTTASADTIFWTDWTSATVGEPGVAAGTITLPGPSTVGLAYAGEVLSTTTLNNTFPSWGPSSTFSGGTVGNPPNIKDIIGLQGGAGTGTNTLMFSVPVVNPVMAILSLGNGGTQASFVFGPSEPFAIQSGGPSNEFGGSSITAMGNSVFGAEGNGTIQFNGTFTQLQWTNPQPEFWYGFTIGVPGVGSTVVPEPGSLALFATGLAGLAGVAWRRRRGK